MGESRLFANIIMLAFYLLLYKTTLLFIADNTQLYFFDHLQYEDNYDAVFNCKTYIYSKKSFNLPQSISNLTFDGLKPF
jgi:hypothetical protein